MLGEAGSPKTEAENIDIFHPKMPEQEYVEIARIEVGDTNDEYSLNQILMKVALHYLLHLQIHQTGLQTIPGSTDPKVQIIRRKSGQPHM